LLLRSDVGEFTKSVLRRVSKHSNFASFVRQLNKYSFHKVRHARLDGDDTPEQSWEFTHPHFRRGSPNLLAQVVRKPVPQRPHHHTSSSPEGDAQPPFVTERVESLALQNESLRSEMTQLDTRFESLRGAVDGLQRAAEKQTELLRALTGQLAPSPPPPPPLPPISSYDLTLAQLNDVLPWEQEFQPSLWP